MDTDRAAAVGRIEALIHEEVGRNISGLFTAAKGGLWQAASALAAAVRPSVGIVTGFYVPLGTPPAAETDGPVGAAMLAGALTQVGVPCRVVTDEPCRATCAAALRGMDVPLDVVPLGGAVDDAVALWRRSGVTHALSIERCGISADGAPRNMRGGDKQHVISFRSDLNENQWGAIIGFTGGVLAMVIATRFSPPKPISELRGLVWGHAEPDTQAAAHVPWYKSPLVLGIGVLVLSAALYVYIDLV